LRQCFLLFAVEGAAGDRAGNAPELAGVVEGLERAVVILVAQLDPEGQLDLPVQASAVQGAPGEVDAAVGSAGVLEIEVPLVLAQSQFPVGEERLVLDFRGFHRANVGRAPVGQVLVPDDMPRSACSALDWRESVPTLYRAIADAVKDMSGQRAAGVFAAVRMDRRARCSDVDPEDVVLAGGFDACTGMGHGAMPMGCGN